MPNLITHKIFAEEVLKRLHHEDIIQMIKDNEQLYYIGSNGPDPLFFYGATPWNLFHDNLVSQIGNTLHCGHVNDFFRCGLDEILKQKKDDIKTRMSVYLFGHLCHWAIDSSAHPYVYYRTGDCTGMSLNYHHRFESVLDETMLRTYRNCSIKEYYFPDICLYNQEILQAIARIYVPTVKKLFQSDIRVYDIRKALDGWRHAQEWLYDPHHYKIDAWLGYEMLRHQKWQMSGNIVPNHDENDFDVLNLKKEVWKHPCDHEIISNDSFPEIFEKAVRLAVKAIEVAYQYTLNEASLQALMDILQDRAYDTGMAGFQEMKYFDIIFEK